MQVFTDCSKGFNLLSWEWVLLVLTAAGLPFARIRGIGFMMHTHLTYLSFDGRVFDCAELFSRYSQGHPLSVYLYILAVDPFLRAAAAQTSVRKVWGFCDDWILSLAMFAGFGRLCELMTAFEQVSGRRFNWSKCFCMPN